MPASVFDTAKLALRIDSGEDGVFGVNGTMYKNVIRNALGGTQNEIDRLTTDGFTSMKDLVSHHENDLEMFRSYLKTLNKTFRRGFQTKASRRGIHSPK